jgi:hypothetical protein
MGKATEILEKIGGLSLSSKNLDYNKLNGHEFSHTTSMIKIVFMDDLKLLIT